MPILRLNAGPEGLRLHGSPSSAMSALRTAATGTGPVIVMIHGFKYDPSCATHSPHSKIFDRKRRPDRHRDTLWLPHLGFDAGDHDEGLAIAFGWPARNNLWRAQRSARAAGQHLARIIAEIRCTAPQRPIHAITHSMGSEVIFEAMRPLPAHSVQRIVTMTGASFVSRAEETMQNPAGQTAELFNITSRENDLFDFVFERLMTNPASGDRAMGVGLALPNAVNIQLDCTRTLAHLAAVGGHIEVPQRRICHWSGYTRPGALRFYARLMRHCEDIPLAKLQVALPCAAQPRWSRMFAPPRLALTLPIARKRAS